MLACHALGPHGILPSSLQIAQRFALVIWNVDAHKVARAQEMGKFLGVSAVGLNTIARAS